MLGMPLRYPRSLGLLDSPHTVVELAPHCRGDDDRVATSQLVNPEEGVSVGHPMPGEHRSAALPRKWRARVVGWATVQRWGEGRRVVEHRRPISLCDRLVKPDLGDANLADPLAPVRSLRTRRGGGTACGESENRRRGDCRGFSHRLTDVVLAVL